MNKIKIDELKRIFLMIDDARQSILKSFPYNKATILFCKNLKTYLKEYFGTDINFDRDEKFACIHGNYKNVDFEINTWNGITLTIEDEQHSNIINDFKNIFNEIIGNNPICSYDYCSQMKTVYPTIEWNLHPEERLCAIINMPDNLYGCYKQNFIDFYHTKIINDLGDKILTQNGYNMLFRHEIDNIQYYSYKIQLIKWLRPDINDVELHNWIDSYKIKNNKKLNKSRV